MPLTTVAKTCDYGACSKQFETRDKRQRYCSRACVWADARAKLATVRVSGIDPTKGGAAADARRASLARRRAAGELIGRAAAKARREGTYEKPDTPPAPLPIDEQGAAWLESGDAWEKRATVALDRDRGKTLVLAGHGAGLRVERDALIVTDGHTHTPHTPPVHTLHRAVHGVERIICLAPTGALSFAALTWCREQGISLLVLDRDGAIVSTITREDVSDVPLRRRQYGAALMGHDMALAHWLIGRKIQGQRDTLHAFQTLPGAAASVAALDDALAYIKAPGSSGLDTIIGVMTFEGRASAAYFQAWRGYPLTWKQRDRRYVPPHWTEVRERHSPLSDSARRAIDPVNAVLNYAYAVLEGQCKLALIREGFDTACGFLHADRQYRDSLVYDLMELYRPVADGLVLSLIDRTTFSYGDFTHVSDGQCRLHPQLARAVVAACRLPQARVDAGARALRTLLLDGVIHEGPL